MRIALIVPAYDLDHEVAIPAVTTLARSLTSRVDLSVYATRFPHGPRSEQRDGLRVVATGGPGVRARTAILRAIRAIRADHRSKPFDVLHGLWLFEPGLIAVLAGKLLGVPAMVSIGGAEPAALPGIAYGGMLSRQGRLIHRRVMRHAQLVTGGSGYVLGLARTAVPGHPASRFRLAPLPVDTERFTPAVDGAPVLHAPRLLHVGAFIAVKQQELSVRAFARVHERHPDARLILIGEDPHGRRGEIERLARDLGVGGAVEMRERAPQAELAGLYRSADIHLLPSLHESQGMVALEAAACGVPTVGSDVGVVADLAPDAALAVPRGDPDALSNAIIALLSNDGRRHAMGARARQRVEECYAATPVTERFLALYGELARGR